MPGRRAIQWILLASGLLLCTLFVVPWGWQSNGTAVFSWHLLQQAQGQAFLQIAYLAIAGVLFLITGSLPLPYFLRGLLAFGLGILPLAATMINADWRQSCVLMASVFLPAALFLRWKYRESFFARVLVGIFVAVLLTTLFVPSQGELPLFSAIKGLSSLSWAQGVLRVFPLALALLSFLCLLALVQGNSTGLAPLWAVCLLLFTPVQQVVFAILGGRSFPPGMFFARGIAFPLALLVFLGITSLGLFQLFSRGSVGPKAGSTWPSPKM